MLNDYILTILLLCFLIFFLIGCLLDSLSESEDSLSTNIFFLGLTIFFDDFEVSVLLSDFKISGLLCDLLFSEVLKLSC